MHRLLAVLTAALLALGLAAPTASADDSGSLLPQLPTAFTDPPGANDWSCRPTARRPTPVILVHGTFGDRKHLLEQLSKSIKAKGFCVYSLDYGNRATRDIVGSAKQLKSFTRRVLRSTGAAKVSMVGHSQGGMMPRYFIKFLGGVRIVDDLVGIAPSNHGTSLTGAGSAPANPLTDIFGMLCRSCLQQGAGSDFLRRLNAGDETPGRVSYTQITTRYDEVVVPHTSGYLERGPRTTNVTIQEKCASEFAEHIMVPMSRTTIALTLNALTRRGPARKDFPATC